MPLGGCVPCMYVSVRLLCACVCACVRARACVYAGCVRISVRVCARAFSTAMLELLLMSTLCVSVLLNC